MQHTHLDVDYQWKERAKTIARLEELKKARVIPREKPPANFSFEPATVDLPSPPQPIPFASKDSYLRFEMFIGRNQFDLRTNLSTFFSLLLFFSSYFPILSNPFLAKNPCYIFYSLSPSMLKPNPPRPSSIASLRSLLKPSSIA